MEIVVNQLKRGVYEVSNQMNTIRLEYAQNMRYDTFDGRYHPGWGFRFNGTSYVYKDKVTAMNAAFDFLRKHNAFDIEGFLNHMDNKYSDELDEMFAKTIRNIIDYGLKNECLTENQFVDWLVKILYNAEVEDVVLFTNDMWLDEKYLQIKNNQYFIFKGWSMAHEIWPSEISRVDCGPKKNLWRGYRIEITNNSETKWLGTEYVKDNETLASVFNDELHLNYYRNNNWKPTGNIAFMGYFKLIDPEQSQFINNFERID